MHRYTTFHRTLLWLVLVANVIAIIGLWWVNSGSLFTTTSDALVALGRLAGLCMQGLIFLQLVLIGRIQFVESAFGHDRMNRLHRSVGFFLGTLIVAHPVLLSVGYAGRSHAAPLTKFLEFIRDFDGVLNALFALIIVVGAVIAALPPLRRLLDHDRWHLGHTSLYLAVVLAFGHEVKRADLARGWPFVYWCALTAAVVGLVIVYRLLRPLLGFARRRFAVIRVVPESADVFSVEISGRGLESFRYRAGQFANWSFFAKGLLAPHPFSFSKGPRSTTLRITVKVCGKYTARLRAVRPGTKVMIDGPLGGFIECPKSGARYLLVAGGIGVTPLRALAESLTLSGKDVLFFYSAKTPADFVLRKELESLPIQPRLFVTDPHADTEPPISKGRVDGARLQSLVQDLRKREIYICGPTAMIDALITDLGGRGVPRRQLHFERFSY